MLFINDLFNIQYHKNTFMYKSFNFYSRESWWELNVNYLHLNNRFVRGVIWYHTCNDVVKSTILAIQQKNSMNLMENDLKMVPESKEVMY